MPFQLVISSVVLAGVIVTAAHAQELARRRPGDPPPSEAPALPDDQPVPCASLHIDLAPSHSPRSLKDLYDLSDVVVEGVVATTFPSRELGRGLETDALIDVATVWKGSNTIRHVLISQAGGRRGRFCIASPQYALVRPGEKYILFLREDNRLNLPEPAPAKRYYVTGVGAGLFYFENDRMHANIERPEWFLAQYEGQTLEQIRSELQELTH